MKTNNPFGALGQLPNNLGTSLALIANGLGMVRGAPSNTGLVSAGRAMDRDAQQRAEQQRFSQLMNDPNVVGSLPKNIQAILPFMAPQAAGNIVAQYQARTARDARETADTEEGRRRFNLTRTAQDAREAESGRRFDKNYWLRQKKLELQQQIANRPRARQETTEQREIDKKRVGIATESLRSVPSIAQGQRVVAQLEAIAEKGLSPKDRKAAEGKAAEAYSNAISAGATEAEATVAAKEAAQTAAEQALESAIGPIQGSKSVQSFVGSLVPFSQTLGLSNPQTNAAIRRLQSQLEILGGESQKGLGAQSEADARRIRGAIAGLTGSRNAAEFKQNLNIIRNFIERGVGRAQEAARQYPQLGEMYPGFRQRQAPQQQQRLRYNSQTGDIE